MPNFTYKKSITTTLKACGVLDTDKGLINVDGVEKDIIALLSNFNGVPVELVVKVKDKEELGKPAPSKE